MTDIASRLEADLVAATRAKAEELTVLRLLKSALHNEKIAKQANDGLKNEEVLAVFRRERKKRQEAATMYEQGGRAELAAKEKSEAQVIARYLPAAPDIEEVKKVMVRIKQEQGLSGPQSIGPLTKAVLAHFGGAVDGKTVSELAREILSQS